MAQIPELVPIYKQRIMSIAQELPNLFDKYQFCLGEINDEISSFDHSELNALDSLQSYLVGIIQKSMKTRSSSNESNFEKWFKVVKWDFIQNQGLEREISEYKLQRLMKIHWNETCQDSKKLVIEVVDQSKIEISDAVKNSVNEDLDLFTIMKISAESKYDKALIELKTIHSSNIDKLKAINSNHSTVALNLPKLQTNSTPTIPTPASIQPSMTTPRDILITEPSLEIKKRSAPISNSKSKKSKSGHSSDITNQQRAQEIKAVRRGDLVEGNVLKGPRYQETRFHLDDRRNCECYNCTYDRGYYYGYDRGYYQKGKDDDEYYQRMNSTRNVYYQRN